jgi:hypothetical protein
VRATRAASLPSCERSSCSGIKCDSASKAPLPGEQARPPAARVRPARVGAPRRMVPRKERHRRAAQPRRGARRTPAAKTRTRPPNPPSRRHLPIPAARPTGRQNRDPLVPTPGPRARASARPGESPEVAGLRPAFEQQETRSPRERVSCCVLRGRLGATESRPRSLRNCRRYPGRHRASACAVLRHRDGPCGRCRG